MIKLKFGLLKCVVKCFLVIVIFIVLEIFCLSGLDVVLILFVWLYFGCFGVFLG